MTGYTPEPEYVPSPWLEDISDESAAILAQTLLDLAMACEDRYERQVRRYRELQRAKLYDPDQPWVRKPAEPDNDLYRDAQEARAADFNARQLDLFRPESEWDNDFYITRRNTNILEEGIKDRD
jgi:hypothetical protein